MNTNQQFAGKVIAVTGAASGIGHSTAHLLASRGARLSLADVAKDGLEKVQTEIETRFGTEVLLFPIDVRNYDEVESWINGTVEHFGKLDGAANLAGVIPKSIGINNTAEQDFQEWDFVLGVNLTGMMHCLRAQLRAICDNSSIVNASSIAGLQGREKNGAYATSKHGVLGITRSAAKEFGHRGIRVNAICPGRIETPMAAAARSMAAKGGTEEIYNKETINDIALKRVGRPEEVAALIAFLLSDESAYITGNSISIDGGWNC